jgi:hypothetical protein
MPSELLEPDGAQLEIFVEGAFRHCGSVGVVSLRGFYEFAGKSEKPFRITPVLLRGGLRFLVKAAEGDARRAANWPKPVVFAPPVAVFRQEADWRAREEDLLEVPVLSLELDQSPRAGLADLEYLIGPANMVIKSGGV